MLRLHQYEYRRPATLSEALQLLHGRSDAMPIAGGTDLVPNMKHQLWTPNLLVALKAVPELHGVALLDADGNPVGLDAAAACQLAVGACTTLREVARDARVLRWFPSLAVAAGKVAGPQIQNQATLGGNLCLDTRCTYYNQSHFWRDALGYCLKKEGDVCHVTRVGKKCVAAHSADTPPVLITLGAVVDLASAEGERSVEVEDLFIADGKWNTVRRPDELVTRIRIPLPGAGLRTAYHKVRQRASIDFPLLSVALAASVGAGERVEGMTLVVSALGSRPRTVSGLDKIAVGRPLAEVADDVAQQAWKQCHPLENIIVDADWRRAMVPVYVRRAVRQLRQSESVR